VIKVHATQQTEQHTANFASDARRTMLVQVLLFNMVVIHHVPPLVLLPIVNIINCTVLPLLSAILVSQTTPLPQLEPHVLHTPLTKTVECLTHQLLVNTAGILITGTHPFVS